MDKKTLDALKKHYTEAQINLINDVFGSQVDSNHFVLSDVDQFKENMKIWFRGMHTNPEWIKKLPHKAWSTSDAQKMRKYATSLFGPYGKSWGLTDLDFQVKYFGVVPIAPNSNFPAILLTLSANFFYPDSAGELQSFPIHTEMWMLKGVFDKKASIYVYKPEEDCHKKLITDATKKALSFIGVGTDLFEGKHDDGKNGEVDYSSYFNELPQNNQKGAGGTSGKEKATKGKAGGSTKKKLEFTDVQIAFISEEFARGKSTDEVATRIGKEYHITARDKKFMELIALGVSGWMGTAEKGWQDTIKSSMKEQTMKRVMSAAKAAKEKVTAK